jgi:predicted ATPase
MSARQWLCLSTLPRSQLLTGLPLLWPGSGSGSRVSSGYHRSRWQQRRWAQQLLCRPLSVAAKYAARVDSGELRLDPRQQTAVTALEAVNSLLVQQMERTAMSRDTPTVVTQQQLRVENVPDNGGHQDTEGWFGWLSGKTSNGTAAFTGDTMPEVASHQGLYIWGGVGCGKTMLMDMFFESAPSTLPKRRVHFHAFSASVSVAASVVACASFVDHARRQSLSAPCIPSRSA